MLHTLAVTDVAGRAGSQGTPDWEPKLDCLAVMVLLFAALLLACSSSCKSPKLQT